MRLVVGLVILSNTNNKMSKQFESHPVRCLRASDKTWEKFTKRRNKEGLTWDKYLIKLLEDKNK